MSVEYEQITRAVFQVLVDQDQASTIQVRHNLTIPGKFLNHQVDVYWECETGGIKYRTVIECKDWNRPVEQEKLLAFRAKLEDLNNPRGIMVTRSGYQSGAVNYGTAHGIYLFELFEQPPRPPLVVTEGSFGKMKLTLRASANASQPYLFLSEYTHYEPRYAEMKYYPDPDWFQDQVRKFGEHLKSELQELRFPEQPPSSTKLYDDTQQEICTLLDVLRKKTKEMFDDEVTSGRLIHRFNDPTFLKTDLESLPYLKIQGISANITINRHEPIERT